MVVQTSPSLPLASASHTDDVGAHGPSQRTGMMARLHALLPTHTEQSAESLQGNVARRQVRPPPKFLKVRMLTWNMHDSLPKGDLEDLLGPICDFDEPSSPSSILPDLPLSAQHPYHLIVVAGQECPSISGIPMALGAGFKLMEKEREKGKEKEKDMLGDQLRPGCPDTEKSKDEDDDRRRSRRLSLRRHSHQHLSEEDDLAASTATSVHDLLNISHHPPYGWTSMLEDWFCNGGRATIPVHTASQGSDADTDAEPRKSDEVSMSPKSQSTGDLNGRIQSMQMGPYELLVKERMMGLYLAVFIKRDIRNLVHGISKSSVRAGLIGRVGTKGGLGISLNLDGTTLLFLNAHLAAHEGKMQNRLANLAKIKSELAVDTFLSPDDPRMMAEDITDRFDFAFICGDLNFRLDITRLHADWLISQRDYAQALAFDELRRVMQTGEAFVGFTEAPIDFPPTFKYDVLRSKRSKHRGSRRVPRNPLTDVLQHEKFLTEIEERRQGTEEEKSDEEPEFDGEAISVASIAYTPYIDGDDREQGREHDDYFFAETSPRSASTGNLTNKEWYHAAAQKAKAKWLSLLSTSVPHTPIGKWAKFKQSQSSMSSSSNDTPRSPSLPDSPPPEFRSATFPPTPDLNEGTSRELDSRYLTPSKSCGSLENSRSGAPITMGGRTNSTRSMARSEEKEDEEEKFNYDSSYKRRVPSWCDRILWKSTVESELEPLDDDVEHTPVHSRNRMGSLLHVLNPASLRSRKDSTASTSQEVTPTSLHHPGDFGAPRSSLQDVEEDNLEAPHTPRSRPLRHSKSIDFAPTANRPFMNRSKSYMMLREERTRHSSFASLTNVRSPSLPNPRPQETPHPRETPRSQETPRMLAAAASPREMQSSSIHTTSRWRSLSFRPFLSRDAVAQNMSSDRSPTPETPPPPPPRKGDVICLSYDTLDDMAMRRLQSKSDHRPVIGSYAIYI